MSGEQFVDVTYRGLEVGRGLRLCEVAPTTAYLELPQPMPVGTELDIATGQGFSLRARVVRVQEQVAGAEMAAGMRVRVGALQGEAASWWKSLVSASDPEIPAPARAAAEPEAAAPETAVPETAVPETLADEQSQGRRKTAVMSTDEIHAAMAAADEADAPDAPVPDRAARTEVMSAVDIDAITAQADGDDAATDDKPSPDSNGSNGARGKGKKRRRRRTTRG